MQDRRSRRSRPERLAGCGGTARPHSGHQSAGNPGPFAWLRPAAAPADWKIARLPSRKRSWPTRRDGGRYGPTRARLPRCCWDRTTACAATSTQRPSPGRDTRQLGCFRPAPNHEEPDRDVGRDASAVGLRFRPGTGWCVIDHYASAFRAPQGDRLHRARNAGHHGRRRRGPASGLDTPGTPAPARGCELLELTQPGTLDTPGPRVTSGRHDWRGAHARSGRRPAARIDLARTPPSPWRAGVGRPVPGAR